MEYQCLRAPWIFVSRAFLTEASTHKVHRRILWRGTEEEKVQIVRFVLVQRDTQKDRLLWELCRLKIQLFHLITAVYYLLSFLNEQLPLQQTYNFLKVFNEFHSDINVLVGHFYFLWGHRPWLSVVLLLDTMCMNKELSSCLSSAFYNHSPAGEPEQD